MGAGLISKGLSYAKAHPYKTGANVLFAALPGISTYSESREQGNGIFVSALKAGSEMAYYGTAGWWALGFDAITGAGGMIVNAAESANQQIRSYERDIKNQTPFRANTFVDGQQIYTMRQAGLALAQRSRYQLQQALIGNEAQYMHR